mmetsp:Transcript_19670/g.14399  ORF Transcript_19670/g.14399 Transcript_19670/m.14399 type:complete len:144 (+) Transcript_19670:1217-1648(+)
MLIMIMLLNMLIAIMGDTYGTIKQTEEQAKLKEYLLLIIENEFLINRTDFFHDVKYIISVRIDQEKDENSPQELIRKEIQSILQVVEARFEYSDRLSQEQFNYLLKLLFKIRNASKGRKKTARRGLNLRDREASIQMFRGFGI